MWTGKSVSVFGERITWFSIHVQAVLSRGWCSGPWCRQGRRPAIRCPARQEWRGSVAFPPPDIALLPPLTHFIPSCNKPLRIRGLSDKVTQHVAPGCVITGHHRLPLIGDEAIHHEGSFTPSLKGAFEIKRRVHHHRQIRIHVNALRTGARNDCLCVRVGRLTAGRTEKE